MNEFLYSGSIHLTVFLFRVPLSTIILSGYNSLFLPPVSWAHGMSRWEMQPKLVCSLIPDIPETLCKNKIVAQNKPAEKSQTTLPILGADLVVPYEHTVGSLSRGIPGLEDRAQIFLQAQ